VHSSRRRRLAELALLDPETDAEEIYRRLVLWEFPGEMKLGFQLAFYAPMGVPAIARVLVESGHFLRATTKRSYDSALVMYEIIHGGVDSERAQRMIAMMGRMHDRPDIRPQDFTYVLLALVYEPLQMIDRYGWRPLLDSERQATWLFYERLGARLGVWVPPTFEAGLAWYRQYTQRELAASAEAALLTGAIVGALRSRLPVPLRPLSGQVMSALLDDDASAEALGLPVAGIVVRAATHAGMRVRRRLTAARPAPSESAFAPGQVVRHAYPKGYRLEDLGPVPTRAPQAPPGVNT
jgi:hypothetical protein